MGNTSSVKNNQTVDSSYESSDKEKQEKIKSNKVADRLMYSKQDQCMPDKMNNMDHYIYERNDHKWKYKKMRE